MLDTQAIHPQDEATYAIAVSLTEFLLERGDKSTFIAFVESGSEVGWDTAVERYYKIRNVTELEKHWRESVRLGSKK
jgi:hypothetical protein